MIHSVQKDLRRGSGGTRLASVVDELVLDGGDVLARVDLKVGVLSLIGGLDETPDVDGETDEGARLDLVHVDLGVADLDGASRLHKVEVTGFLLALEAGEVEDDGASLITNQGLDALDFGSVLLDPLCDGLDGAHLDDEVDSSGTRVEVSDLDECRGFLDDGRGHVFWGDA